MDNLTKEQRTRTMRAVKDRDTGPEIRVRRLVYDLGYRYRLHARKLPGCPDIVFPSMKKVIFVHGCFWHSHKCKRGAKQPKANARYWRDKRTRNLLRDKANRARLRALGWKAIAVWECQLRLTETLRRRIQSFLQDGSPD